MESHALQISVDMDTTLYSSRPITACFKECSTLTVLTALLVWRLDVVAITDRGSNRSAHRVSVRLLGFFVQEVIWHEAGVTLVYDVLNVIISMTEIRSK